MEHDAKKSQDGWEVGSLALLDPTAHRDCIRFREVRGHVETRIQIGHRRYHPSWPSWEARDKELAAFFELRNLGVDLTELVSRKRAGEDAPDFMNLGPEGAIKFEDFCEKVFKPHRCKMAGWKQEDNRLKFILKEGSFSGRQIHTIRTKAIQTWYDRYASRPGVKSDNTRAHVLKVVRAVFELAARIKYLRENPALPVRVPEVPESTSRAYSLEETRRLYRAASEALRPWILFIVFTGLRPSEVKRLRVSDVDLTQRKITIRGTTDKNKGRDLYIHDDLFPFIEVAVSSIPNLPLVRNEDGSPATYSYYLFKKARKAANLEDLTFYEGRHTFRTRLGELENPYVDSEVADYLMGHKRRGMGRVYDHSKPFAKGREAIQRLPSISRSDPKPSPKVDKVVDNVEGAEKSA